MHAPLTEESVRVLLETLKLSTIQSPLELRDVASSARVNESVAQDILARVLDIERGGLISVGPRQRIELALEVARGGRLMEASRFLTWQEFEKFGGECLAEAGFSVERNLRVKGDGRAWQIDLAGIRGDLMLTVDCKHWNTPSYASKLRPAAVHQRLATSHLLIKEIKNGRREAGLQALAVILTLAEPSDQFLDGSVIVSVEKLPNFLSGVTPFDENLPLIYSSSVVENPISQA